MSMLRTPYSIKTRLQTKRDRNEHTTSEHEDTNANGKREHLLRQDGSVDDETHSIHSSSSVAARKRLELEAARKKAEIELQLVTNKAEIQKSLINMELEADLADLELEGSTRKSMISSNVKVQNWIRKSDYETPRTKELVCDTNAPVPSPPSLLQQLPQCSTHSLPPQRNDIHQLATALQEAISTAVAPRNSNQELLSRISTSKDLPIYCGDPLEWLQFKNAFYESTELCNYSDTENMWRLRKCLRGEAKEVVSSLLMSNSSPLDVIATLELRFGRPEIIMHKTISHLKKLTPLSQNYQGELIQFSIKIKNYVTAVNAIGQSDYLQSPELVSIIVSKLPTTLVTKWADYYSETQCTEIKKTKLERLSLFLYKEAQKIAICGVSFIHSQSDYKRKPEYVKNTHHMMLTDSNMHTEMCKFCKTNKHALEKCTKFKRALRKDRWRFARMKKLCFKCLSAQHTDVSMCTAPMCDINDCGLPHHRLLHWMKPKQGQELSVADTEEQNNETVAVLGNQCNNISKVFLKVVPVTIHGPKGSVHTHALLDDGSTVTLIATDIANKVGLHGETVTMRARSAWDSGELVCKTEIVDFVISNSSNERFNLQARKINELRLPTQCLSSVDFDRYEILNNKHNLLCKCDTRPKLLIGQDNYHLIAPNVCFKGKPGEPYITNTSLGWCVHGTISNAIDRNILPVRFNTHLSFTQCDSTSSNPTVTTMATTHRALSSSTCLTLGNDTNDSLCQYFNTFSQSDARYGDCFLSYVDSNCFLTNQEYDLLKLHELVRYFYSLESIGISNKPRQSPDDLRAIEILDNSSRLMNGQWTVGLPWKSNDTVMPNSYNNALVRLKSVIRKMTSDKMYATRYQDRINHLFQNNYARGVDAGETSKRIWYLPHFGVDNPNKKKLRLVFDAAAKEKGYCLNDFLLQGPDLLNSLYGIMYRFREFSIAVVGDIKDMFLCIKIQREDQHALRFLWQDENKQIKEYAMTSLIFGANCSPFVAQYINQTKNTFRFKDLLPKAVHAIQNNQYMDDYIDSMEDVNFAKDIVKQVFYIHQQGGFLMRNWMSNKLEALEDIDKEYLSENAEKIIFDNSPERILGLIWYPATDTLAFDLTLKRIPTDILNFIRKPTKRELLRIVMSIFDIHGFLSPMTIKGKIIMQQTWKLGLKWDEKINNELFHCFKNWVTQLRKADTIQIPRCYFHNKQSRDNPKHVASNEMSLSMSDNDSVTIATDTQRLELHVFCDASPHAYAAAAYWRQINNDKIAVSLIGSKSRVTPSSKTISIPRLELQGALLACRLADSIKKEHRLSPSTVHFWTDSTIVLHWIRNENRNYKIFISNRLSEIDELSKISEWRYVPSKLNIADLATKYTDYELSSDDEWFTGPSFLHQTDTYWPCEPETKTKISDDDLESTIIVVFEQNDKSIYLPVPEPRRFSSWLRLLRATAAVLLFIEKCRKTTITTITDGLMRKGEILLLRHAQTQSFYSEIVILNQGKPLRTDSRLRDITPFIDSDGLLRVGGRINAAFDVGKDAKSPIILDGHNYTARLIVHYYHVNAGHSCNELVVNELRQRYWLIRLRPTVRTVASQCYTCRIRRAKPSPPRLGDLPEARLTHHKRPFTVCGVDLFGPMQVTVGRQTPLRYGVLFTCLTVRAIHIETVASLTADALIMALRRMASRRGWPKTIYSDNGTNMRGAAAELKVAFRELDKEALATQAVTKGVDWHFIPPVSPHMGGAWERLVRSVKDALKVVLKERSPKEEILATLLTEIENMVNSRPLTHVSVDPNTQEALTPNHFLIGSSSNMPLPGVFDDGDIYLRKQWRVAQRLADLFWSRWIKEVLPTLLPRRKWQGEGVQLKVGDLVVIVDPSSPRNIWPKGIVEAAFPGKDGRVRVVNVRTKSGVLKRPVTRVALLFGRECRQSDTGGENVVDDNLFY